MFQSNGPVNIPPGGTVGLGAVVLQGIQAFETQADFKSFTKQSPPPFDPTIPIKLWRDTNTARTNVNQANPWAGFTYNFIVRDTVVQTQPDGSKITVYGDAVIEQGEMPGWLAARVNIPPDAGSGPGVTPTYENPDQVFPIDPSIVQAQIVQSPFGVQIQSLIPAAS